jgi:hypothetical protein
MFRFVAVATLVVLITGLCWADTTAVKTFGKAPTITEATPIAGLQKEPAKYVDKSVLVSGRVVDMCRHKGCWVEIESPDSTRIICRSLDESVAFPKDCLGQNIRLQGKVLFDEKASGKKEEKTEGVPHTCPAPKLMVSIEGATVEFAPPTTDVKEQKVEEKKDVRQ